MTTKPGLDFLKKQVIWLRNYADLRVDRQAEINIQLGDLLSFFGLAGRLDASQRKYTLELLTVVQGLTYEIEMQVKHFVWTPRPIDFSPRVMPIIQTPDHSSFPSGHATEAFAIATVLFLIMSENSNADPVKGLTEWAVPFRIAHRIAVNRTVAGVHFPVDSAAGAILGIAIGRAVHALSKSRGRVRREIFRFHDSCSTSAPRSKFGKCEDFTSTWLKQFKFSDGRRRRVSGDDVLKKYWRLARNEWKD